ncbi:MAG: flagellar protein export ATPase FliI [Gammaproteobacteria bacterium]|nr:MAG: flagellar protein export ATPase FliI [Gammaproteobacteria bacterium]
MSLAGEEGAAAALPAVVRRRALLAERFGRWQQSAATAPPLVAEGRLVRMVGMTLEAVGCEIPVGGRCRIVGRGHAPVLAEAVGFAADRTYLMPVGQIGGLTPQARVVPLAHGRELAVDDGLLGRVIDPTGATLDGLPAPRCRGRVPLAGQPINPLSRAPVREPLDVGVRSINALLSIGRGQRMGLFAGSGVGKSVLLGMMARHTAADVIVVGLIGERGREVNEFIQEILGPEGLARAVVVVAPADAPPLMRLQGAQAATAIAEHFRDQGRQVLLLMDSLTRYAQAQREIGLAIGEPPVTRGYPPSVFARLPQLLERAGNAGRGSITGIYTVLAEGDDVQDPVADAARAVLDGHIVLSRRIAERGRYPAVDVEASISRVMNAMVPAHQRELAQRFRQIAACYEQHRDLITVGAYRRGSDPAVDQAIDLYPRLEAFLTQPPETAVGVAESLAELERLIGSGQD